MKKILAILSILLIINPAYAFDFQGYISDYKTKSEVRSVERFFNKQVNYANRSNFKKFISTYGDKYISTDGFDKKVFSEMIKDIWSSYNDVEYDIDIKKEKLWKGLKIVEMIKVLC